MARKPRRKKEQPRFVETTYQGMTVREQKMLRAMQHFVYRNHQFHPNQCEGCLEYAAFLTIPGYQGNGSSSAAHLAGCAQA